MDPKGMVDGPNMYQYCGGDPVNHWDPMGTTLEVAGKPWTDADIDKNLYTGKYLKLIQDMIASPQPFVFHNADVFFGTIYDKYRYWRSRVDGKQAAPANSWFGLDMSVIGGSISSQASGMWEGTKVIFQGDAPMAWDEAVNQQAKQVARIYLEEGDDSWTPAAYVVGNAVGTTQLVEAGSGYDTIDRQEISTSDRWSRGLTGFGSLTLSLAGGAQVWGGLKAGYTGTGFTQAWRWATTYTGTGLSRTGWAASWLRAGPKGGWRRSILASDTRLFRLNSTRFYTVQTANDAARLRGSGKPWPTADTASNMGEGVYSWSGRAEAEAEAYLNLRQPRIADPLEIVPFRIENGRLASFRYLDVDALENPDAWMSRYSKLWGGEPDHGFEYITRNTAVGKEHFFDKSVHVDLSFTYP